MTRKSTRAVNDNHWQAQEAKARFSEVMRRAREAGPQYITVHGREESVVLSADEYRKLKGSGRTGKTIVEAFAASPFKEVEIEPRRYEDPIRPVVL